MRTISCVSALAIVIAAICLSSADEKSAQDRKAPAPAAQRSDKSGVGTAAGKAAKPAQPTETRDKKADGVVVDESTTPDKYAADREAIVASAEAFVAAYVARDASAIAALFAPDAEYVDENGKVSQGRKEIERTLKEFFENHDAARIEMEIDSLRFLRPDLAVEDGATTCYPTTVGASHHSRYTAIHTKIDGKWLVASVREHGAHGQRVRAAQLRQLDWLVGDWIDQDDDSVVHFQCNYSGDGNFLIRNFTVSVAGAKVISGTQRIGWDPSIGKLRAWTFDSDGGHFDGIWAFDGERWILTSSGITSDGRAASGVSIFTPVNRHSMTWQAVNRQLDGMRLPDSEEFALVRMGPAPGNGEKSDGDKN